MRNYNKSNCTGCVRGQFIDIYERRITIVGQHAFSYTIEIVSILGVSTYERYSNGKQARKRFNELKRKRR